MFSDDFLWMNIFITARKRSLWRLWFYRCVSVHGGEVLPQCMLGYPPAKETPLPRRPPTKETPLLLQAHTQGGNWGGSDPGPRLRGKLRGIKSRPTPKGEIEGDQIQAHTQGGNWGGSNPGPHPRGKLRGIRSRPTLKGEIERDQIQAHTQGGNWGGSGPGKHPNGKFRGIRTRPPHNYCCGQYASYWNAFLLQYCAQIKFSHTHTHTHTHTM